MLFWVYSIEVCLRCGLFSPLSCFIMLHCSCRLLAHSLPYLTFDNWENIVLHLIIIIKSEVWTITHCLGFSHETMVRAVCTSLFLGMLNFEFSILGTSESWLTEVNCDLYSLAGCNLIKQHIEGRSGGGVCIFVKKFVKNWHHDWQLTFIHHSK